MKDKIYRQQHIVEKAQENREVFRLYEEYSGYLPKDEIATDTLLKLTYKYDPKEDFLDQFKRIYLELKKSYEIADRCFGTISLGEHDVPYDESEEQDDYSIHDDQKLIDEVANDREIKRTNPRKKHNK